jgi:PKD repeat protein
VWATPVGSNYDQATSHSVSIKLTPPTITAPPGSPVANFVFSPSTPKVGTSVQFDGSLSTDDGGRIVSYDWTFGDGVSKSGITTAHDYDSAGTYTVKLTITDDRGQSASRSKTVTITGSN